MNQNVIEYNLRNTNLTIESEVEKQILNVAAYCRVSTRGREQAKSLRSTILYYTNLVNTRTDWTLVDVYVDTAMSGTRADNRSDFQRMIEDCKKGLIDLIITKSLSRFSRNVDDIMYYIYMLKEIGVAVFFEVENINTLAMSEQDEKQLVFLATTVQQEANNAAANSRVGIQMKMKRGELVGFNDCLGYDYNLVEQSLTINELEAEIVRLIFRRYLEGAGAFMIAKELTDLGYKTKYGSPKWQESTIRGILKNEKYKGAVLQGKTITVDSIKKRRIANLGQSDMYLCENHHEPIIPIDEWNAVQEMMKKRSAESKTKKGMFHRKHSRKYPFSSVMECGFCKSNYYRKSWNGNTPNAKAVWSCVTAKIGKQHCEHSKAIPETMIEEAFVKSYNELLKNKTNIMIDFLSKEENKTNNIDFDNSQQQEISLRMLLESDLKMESFDQVTFDNIIEDIIIGEVIDKTLNPYMLTFIYKAGISNKIDVKVMKNSKKNIHERRQVDNNIWLLIPSNQCQ